MTTTPLSLLERLRAAPDEASWARLVALYSPWLEWFLRQAGVPAAEVDDLRQEALAVMVRELSAFEHNGHTGAFRRWMREIVLNRVRGYWRARQSAQRVSAEGDALKNLEDPLASLESVWDREHDRHMVEGLLKIVQPGFSSSTWLAFQRQVIDGVRAADVAAELGMSVNAVLLAKSRVLQRLRSEARLLIDES